jgi:YhcH/YjgK/YiaL family protein
VILDRLENVATYRTISAELVRAFDYLSRTDFSDLPAGRYALDGDRVYAIVQRYRPKPLTEAKWESHRRYLDVQYIAEGSERLGHALLDDGVTVEQQYNAEKDVIFYKADGDFFTLRAGSFAIFAPQDIHAPGLALDGPGDSIEVCKVVVKCRLEP